MSRRHYDYGQPVAMQASTDRPANSRRARPFPATPSLTMTYEAAVEPFGAARPLQENAADTGGCNPVLTVEAVEKQTYHPDLHLEGNNGALHSGADTPAPPAAPPAPEPPSPASPVVSASGFDFDRADRTVFSDEQSVSTSGSPDFDSFERELAHLLSGNVPERVARKVEEIDRQASTSGVPPAATPPPPVPPPPPPANPHDIFDQITASRLNSRVFDLGTFEVQKQKLDDFDQLLERQQASKKTSTPLPEPAAPAEIMPMNVAMSDLDLAEDFHRMGIALDKGKTAPPKSAPAPPAPAPSAPASPAAPASPSQAVAADPPAHCTCPPGAEQPASDGEANHAEPENSEPSQPTTTS